MKQLGWMEEWLEATVKSPVPPVAFTSLFPFQGPTLFVTPPATLWPPPASLLTTPNPVFLSKIRWNVANFIPVSLIETILLGQNVLADQWLPDPESACLLRRDRLNTTPFHIVVRTGAAVDRLTASAVSVHTSACVEFEPGAGLWTIARYRDEAANSDWGQRMAAAFRLLADQGFGGKRSSGWGQTEAPQFEAGSWPGLLLPRLARALARRNSADDSSDPPMYWLLSLFTPAEADKVDWSGGDYRTVVRGGFVDGAPAGTSRKKQVRMIAEGSVLVAPEEPIGTTVDVAPDASSYPVYRSGVALCLRLPVFVSAAPEIVETSAEEQPAEPEAVMPEPAEPVEPGVTEAPPSEEPEEAAIPAEPVSDQPVADEPVADIQSSIETVEERSANPPGSPELGFRGEVSSEVEPQGEGERFGSVEDPGAGGGGPDHGI